MNPDAVDSDNDVVGTEESTASSTIQGLLRALQDTVDSEDQLNPLTDPRQSAPEPDPNRAFQDYLLSENRMLQDRQRHLQEQLQNKAKEMQGIRETILVVSGALQAIQHVATHVGLALPSGS